MSNISKLEDILNKSKGAKINMKNFIEKEKQSFNNLKVAVDLPEAGASAECISSVMRSNTVSKDNNLASCMKEQLIKDVLRWIITTKNTEMLDDSDVDLVYKDYVNEKVVNVPEAVSAQPQLYEVRALKEQIEMYKECFELFIPNEKWDEATKFLSTYGSGLARDILRRES